MDDSDIDVDAADTSIKVKDPAAATGSIPIISWLISGCLGTEQFDDSTRR